MGEYVLLTMEFKEETIEKLKNIGMCSPNTLLRAKERTLLGLIDQKIISTIEMDLIQDF